MPSIQELVKGIKPVTAYPKIINFGPVSLDGYMLEDGSFRQSLTSTGKALGTGHWIAIDAVSKILTSPPTKNPVVDSDLSPKEVNSPRTKNPGVNSDLSLHSADSPGAIIQPVVCPGVANHSGSVAYAVNLPMVVEIWKSIALSGGKYARPAMELLGLSAVHSLERAYQEAFGVEDARKTSDRLLEWAIRLDTGKHYPLFGGQFHQNFARVTGVTIGHPYAQVCLAELVYHRLPGDIYETLKDINPVDDNGWRQYSHSQFMTDDMRQQMREIVAAVNSQLACTASKADDAKAYKECLHRLDKTLPRYKKRGCKKLQENIIEVKS